MARKRTIDVPQPGLTDEMWEELAPPLPEPEPSPEGRTFAWLGNSRRPVVRYERHLKLHRAFFRVACLRITLRQL